MAGNTWKANITTVITSVILLLVLTFIGITSIELRSSNAQVYIYIEAEKADSIEYPIEISEDAKHASGGKFIKIREYINADLGDKNGTAVYKIKIKQPGKYVFWGRVKWQDGCGNSFFFEIRNVSDKSLLGEDGLYGVWHWVMKPTSFFLKEGEYEIVLSNAEDGVNIDKILLTNDLSYIPEGMNQGGIKDNFEDGSTINWKPRISGKWSIRHDICSDKLSYYQSSSKIHMDDYLLRTALIPLKDFMLICRIRSTQPDEKMRNYRILFNYQNDSNFYYVDFGNRRSKIVIKTNGKETILGKSSNHKILVDTMYHEINIIRHKNSIAVRYDQMDVMRVADNTFTEGKIGVGSLYGSIYIDNVQYLPLSQIFFTCNFYIGYKPHLDGWVPINGIWHVTDNLESALSYGVRAQVESKSVVGESWWYNYYVRTAVKTITGAAIGICFYYQNENNYYLFRVMRSKSGKHHNNKRQLIKVVNGKKHLLKEDYTTFYKNQWYVMKVEIFNNRIRTYIDNTLVFDINDSDLGGGKIGLYADSVGSTNITDSAIKLLPQETQEHNEITTLAQEGSTGIGVAFFCQNQNNYYLFKWNAESKDSCDANKMQLIEVLNGNKTILAERKNISYKIGDYYQLKIKTHKGNIKTFIDNLPIFDINDDTFTAGKLGLFRGRDIDACFDDVEVKATKGFKDDLASVSEKPKLYADSISEYRYHFVTADSVAIELSNWRVASGYWDVSLFNRSLVGQKDSEDDALIWHKNKFPEENVSVDCSIQNNSKTGIFIIFCGNGRSKNKGYTFSLKAKSNFYLVELQRDGKTVTYKEIDLIRDDKWINIRIQKKRKTLLLFIDKVEVLKYYDENPIIGNKIGIGITGGIDKPVYFDYIAIIKAN